MDSEERPIRKKMVAHLKALMSDAQLYGWDRARTFYGVWLNQLRFRRALVWHLAPPSLSAAATTRTLARTNQCSNKSPTKYNALARPGTKACKAYTEMGCLQGGKHPKHQHICSFCLLTINGAFPHPGKDSIRKGHST